MLYSELVDVGQESRPDVDEPEEAVHPDLALDEDEDDETPLFSEPKHTKRRREAEEMGVDVLLDFENTSRGNSKKKRMEKKRFHWQEEHEGELQQEFEMYIDIHQRLPPGREIEAMVARCPLLQEAYKKEQITISSIKNKLCRMYPIVSRRNTSK